MKFTSEDLAKAMGLEIGDRVKVKSAGGDSCVYKLNQDYSLSSNTVHIHLDSIIELDYEIIPKTKKVGELICNEVGCANCPLYKFLCRGQGSNDLYTILFNNYKDDKEIYDILKARLDKEVE